MLGFGHAVTIDAIQGSTADEHINALPRGAAGLTAFKAYVAESRARSMTWTMVSHAAVHEAEKRSRALGDPTPILEEDLWKRIGADMSFKPYKTLAIDLAPVQRQNAAASIASFLRQSHAIFTSKRDGIDVGLQTRQRLEEQNANEILSGQLAALKAAVAENDPIYREALAAGDALLTNGPGKAKVSPQSPAPQLPAEEEELEITPPHEWPSPGM